LQHTKDCLIFAINNQTKGIVSLPTDEDILLQQLRDPKTRQATFSELVKAYSESLYWHIRRMVLSHHDADDLLQNTFMKAWTGIDGFLGNAKVITWLYRIATNETITFLNKPTMFSADDIETSSVAIESDEWFDGDELQARLQAAIQTLPPKQRMVFNMKYYEDMRYEDMSAILGTSVGALKASYHLAVKKISSYFDDDI
jgi:RNA polymerase sigma-70 factor (ECF subfamily)